MSAEGQSFTKEMLRQKYLDDIRKIASKLGISRIISFSKNELIDIILDRQAQPQAHAQAPPKLNEPEDSDVSELTHESRFNGKISIHTYIPKESQTLSELIEFLYPKLIFLAGKENGENGYKISIGLKTTLHSPKFDEGMFYIQSKMFAEYVENKLDKIFEDLETKISEKDTEGSGWKIVSIDEVCLNVGRYIPLKGSSYVELPDFLKNKRAILNIHNLDQKCFLWSILGFLFPTDFQKENSYSYVKYINKLDTSMLNHPQKLDSSLNKLKRSII